MVHSHLFQAFYNNGLPILTNKTSITTNLPAGNYTVYAIIFDVVGNPLKTNSTSFTITSTSLPSDEVDDDTGKRKDDMLELYIYYIVIFIVIGVFSIIILTKNRFTHVNIANLENK